MISVMNVSDNRQLPPTAVYVGRPAPRRGLAGSLLANPYRVQGAQTRDDAIRLYAEWLDRQLVRDGAARREFDRLVELARAGDLILACWCHPEACHADVLKTRIEQMIGGAE